MVYFRLATCQALRPLPRGYGLLNNPRDTAAPERVGTCYFDPMKRIMSLLIALLAYIAASVGQAQTRQMWRPAHTSDNSDWWSQIRAGDANGGIAVQKREPQASNLRILGVDLADNDLLSKASAKLGKAQPAERGDASTGRSQTCYSSAKDDPKIYVVFETGELSDAFYLFMDGPDWSGSDRCVKSNLVIENLSVASGLRLGQTPAEVMAILGKPSAAAGNKIVYSFAVEKKTPDRDFDRLRRQHPELSDEDLHRDYEFYSLGIYIEARFNQSKLTYLAVSKTEAY